MQFFIPATPTAWLLFCVHVVKSTSELTDVVHLVSALASTLGVEGIIEASIIERSDLGLQQGGNTRAPSEYDARRGQRRKDMMRADNIQRLKQ